MQRKLVLTFFIAVFTLFIQMRGSAQTVTITLQYTGAQALGCCSVCTGDYFCWGGSCGCCTANGNLTFTDPVPAGNIITGVSVNFFGVDCGGGAFTIPTAINGTSVGSAPVVTTDCSCGGCYSHIADATFPCTGLPGYNYGGSNTLQPSPGQIVCMDRVEITFTYVPNSSFALPPIGSISGPSTGCAGGSGTYTVPAVAGATTYTWTVPAGTTIVSGQGTTTLNITNGSTSGNICVTASSACDTEGPTCYPVTFSAIPTVNDPADQTVCAGTNTAAVNFTGTGGPTYNWTNDNTTIGLAASGTGNIASFVATNATGSPVTANITVTPVTGCSGTPQTFTITVNPSPTMTDPADQTVCANSLTTTTSFTGSIGGTTFGWTNSNTTIGLGASGSGDIAAFTGLNAGALPVVSTVTVTPTVGTCSGPAQTFTYTINPNPTFVLSATNPSSCGGTDGSIIISGLSGSTSYNVTYTDGIPIGPAAMTSDGAGTIIISGLNAGSYSNFIVSLGGCTTTDASVLTLTDPNPPTVGAGTDQTVCAGTSVTLTATNPDGAVISWDNGVTDGVAFTPASTLTYTVTANLAGCISTDQVIVTVNPNPTIGAGTDQTICSGSPVTLTANNPDGAAISWDNGVTDGVAFTPAATLTYTVTGNLSGCISTDQVVVTVNPLPTFALSSTNPSACGSSDGSIIISGLSASTTYDVTYTDGVVTGPTSMTSDGVGTIVISGMNAGTYSNFIVSLNGCDGTTASTLTLVDPTPPTVNAGVDFSVCAGSPATLMASNPDGAAISWDNGVTDGVSFTPGTTTTYTVTANLAGCIATDQAIITVNILPAVGAGPDQSVCIGDPATLTATNPDGAAISWNNGVTDGVAFTPASTLTYTVTATLVGCSTTDQVVVTVNPLPVVTASASPSTNLCVGDLVTLSGGGASTYTWDNGVTNGVAFVANTTTTYTVTGTDANSCQNTATITLTVVNCAPPVAQIGTSGSPSTICVNDCINFQDLSTGTNIDTWLWDLGAGGITSTAQNPPTMCYGVTGTYTITLTVTDDVGTDTETFTLTVIDCIPPTAVFTMSDSVICLGECITLTDQSLENPTAWAWDFGGAASPGTSTDQNPTICPTVAGTYDIELTVTNPFGTSTVTHTLTVNAIPVVNAGIDTIIDMNTAAELIATVSPSGGTYQWTDEENVECPDCPSTFVTPVFTEQFQLLYISPEGCAASDSVLVVVLFEDLVNVPNGFSPNNDNNNDVVFVKGEGIVDMHFVIYNRYGQLVFESFDQKIGWDGYLNGRPENPGVFVWYLEYTLVDGSSNSKKGNLTLIK
ncbi:MAG: gliding motility-associated C-terminal domain-containing protein [Bacteroidetes bacterium]|nr:gliding motility-associated C-terminal domain-containing protein [Bacteroidota bacterium]